jgi:hypothetical protein
MTPDPRAARGPRKRALGAVLATVLMLAGLVVVTTQSAGAAPQNVTTGTLTWGVKQSFRNYIGNPALANGTITPSGGATQNPDGTFAFPAASASTFDTAAATPTASFTGSVRFLGHDGELDITVSNIRIVGSGAAGTLVADVVSLPLGGSTPTTYTGVELTTVTGGTYATSATTASWTAAATALTAAGQPAFANFYPAGEAFDPVSFTLTLEESEPEPEPADGSILWKVSQQAWTASSLQPAHAAGAPATLGTDGWSFPSTAVSYDPATGITDVAGAGSLTLGNIVQGGYRIHLADPSIHVDATGAGSLSAGVSYCASTAVCADPGPNTPVRVVVANFSVPEAAITDTGSHVSWTVTPDYPSQNDPTWPTFGQFPQTFLDALPASLQGHFRDSASGTPPAPSAANANKPPAPLTVSFDYTPVTPEPEGVVQHITTEVLENGGLTISVADDTVVLPTPMPNSTATELVTTGAINPVTVTDLRLANPGWSANGQVGDFAGAGSIDGSGLGWRPTVDSSSSGQTVTAGAPVAAGVGDGLKASSTLGSAPAGAGRGTAVLGAGLELKAPTTTPPGVYTATLTLTVI